MSGVFLKKRFNLNFHKPSFHKPGFRQAMFCAIFCAVIASALFLYENFHQWRLNPFKEIELQNILMAKTDIAGDTYIVDRGRSRVVKMNNGGRADYEIDGENGKIFYNACDIAVENEKSFFVHEVIWDENGMDAAAERILEFDKNSGALGRELYRLDRNEPGVNRNLSGLIALNALKFEAGKLWFLRKSEDFFALFSLVPGEEAVMEHLVVYDDALETLGNFAVDIGGGRIFFLDKAGVLMVVGFNQKSEKNEIKVVFNPVSGVSAREFSLPYRLALGGSELYFSDIGKRAVMRLKNRNAAEIVFGGWKGDSLPPLYSFVHARGGLLTLAGDSSIVGFVPAGVETFRVSSLPAGYRIVLLRICLWISALILIPSLLFVFRAIFRSGSSGKMSAKELLSFAVIMGMGSTFLAVTPTIFNELGTTVKNKIMDHMSYVLDISSKILDMEALTEIKTPQDYNGPAYRRFKRSLENLVEREKEWNRQIYCDVFKFKDGMKYYVCYLNGGIGAFFPPASFEESDVQTVFGSGEWIKDMDLVEDASGSYMSLSGPLYNADGSVGGGMEIGVDLRALEDSIRALARNAIIHILLILALLLFLAFEVLESIPFAKTRSAEENEEIPAACLRPLTFVVFLAFNLSTGFLPNYALKMGGSFMGLSSTISSVLPITVCDVMLVFAPLVLPFLIARAGRYLVFLLSFLLCFAGYAISAAAAAIGALIVGMALLGLGAGVLFTLMQSCIASRKDADSKALGFSSFAAASFSGINCGIMIGGIIATNFGQNVVFSFGAFLWIAVMAAFLVVARKKAGAWASAGARKPVRASREVFSGIAKFLLFSFFPFTLYSGFIYYLVPVFGNRAGFSDTEISLVFVFFGVGIMFLGPKIVAFARGETNKISSLLWLAFVIETAGVLCFAPFQSTAAMLIAVFILGSAFGIGNVYFPLYLTEMPEAKKLGEGGGMALFNFTENLGFAAGPMIFSAIFHSGNPMGYYALAAVTLLTFLAYRLAHPNAA
jgi:predicted MFS family arabinose efflux permease